MKNIRIIDVRQSRTPNKVSSFVRTGLIFAALFGPGVLVDSAAMQWAGFVLLMFYLVAIVIGWNAIRMTIQEAREELDKLEKQ